MTFKNSTFGFHFLIILLFNNIAHAQPERNWVSYYGGEETIVTDVHFDRVENCIYVVGHTADTAGIATPGSHQDTFSAHPTNSPLPNYDAFLAKFDTTGTRIWATYYGGNKKEYGTRIMTDKSGNVYISGKTESDSGMVSNGMTLEGTLSYLPGGSYLAKFSAQGNLIWSRYIPGSIISATYYNTYGKDLLVTDRQNNVYICGGTLFGERIATSGAYKENITVTTPFPNTDAFIIKMDSNGVRQWGTYYGGDEDDWASGIYLDENDHLYMIGQTTSDTGIATAGSHQANNNTGSLSSFLVKFDQNGQREWGTYISGDGNISALSITGDGLNNVYLYGATKSSINIASAGSWQPNLSGYFDAFLMKFNSMGQRLWGTYFGGTGNENSAFGFMNTSICLSEKSDYLYIGGPTSSLDLVVKGCPPYPAQNKAGFLTKFDIEGDLVWSSYYDAFPYQLTLGLNNDFYFIGQTEIDSLGTAGAFKENKLTGENGSIIARFKDNYICPELGFDITQNGDTLFVTGGYEQYTWFKNGIAIGGSDSFLIVDSSDADYFVKIKDSCGCHYQTNIFEVTGISDKEYMVSIRLFPNPNKGKFWLKGMINMPQENLLYTVSDLQGKVLQEGSFRVKNRIIDQEIDCSELTAGMYFLKINFESNKKSNLKIVIKK